METLTDANGLRTLTCRIEFNVGRILYEFHNCKLAKPLLHESDQSDSATLKAGMQCVIISVDHHVGDILIVPAPGVLLKGLMTYKFKALNHSNFINWEYQRYAIPTPICGFPSGCIPVVPLKGTPHGFSYRTYLIAARSNNEIYYQYCDCILLESLSYIDGTNSVLLPVGTRCIYVCIDFPKKRAYFRVENKGYEFEIETIIKSFYRPVIISTMWDALKV